MSLSPMSHVESKKRLCRPVDFRGQGPYWSAAQPAGSPPPPPSAPGSYRNAWCIYNENSVDQSLYESIDKYTGALVCTPLTLRFHRSTILYITDNILGHLISHCITIISSKDPAIPYTGVSVDKRVWRVTCTYL